jgi:hypothetical protein
MTTHMSEQDARAIEATMDQWNDFVSVEPSDGGTCAVVAWSAHGQPHTVVDHVSGPKAREMASAIRAAFVSWIDHS